MFSPPVIQGILDYSDPVEVNLKPQCYDLIITEMIKNLPNIGFDILVKLFNAILKVAYYPKSWQISQIILIAKPGKDLSLPSSDKYRPSYRHHKITFMFVRAIRNCLAKQNEMFLRFLRQEFAE